MKWFLSQLFTSHHGQNIPQNADPGLLWEEGGEIVTIPTNLPPPQLLSISVYTYTLWCKLAFTAEAPRKSNIWWFCFTRSSPTFNVLIFFKKRKHFWLIGKLITWRGEKTEFQTQKIQWASEVLQKLKCQPTLTFALHKVLMGESSVSYLNCNNCSHHC